MAIDPALRIPLVDARGNINPNLDSISVADLGCCDSIGKPTDPEATGDGSVIAILKRNRTLLGVIAGAVVALGGLTFIGSRLATDSVTATATAAAPTYAEGADVKLSVDLAGTLRTSAGGGGGNPSGGFLDSLRAVRLTTGQTHVGRATVDSILANFTHVGRAAVDSILPNMTHVGRVAIDSSVLLFASLSTGQLHAGRVAVDSILANFTHVGRVAVDSLLDSLVTVVGALPVGQNHLGRVAVDSLLANQTHIGRVAVDSELAVGTFAPLAVTATAAVNTGVTATLPAVAGQFAYITELDVEKLYSVIGVAAGAGVICTTTNLPGNPAFTTQQLASAAGTVAQVVKMEPTRPLRSAVVNTATTIVCPAQLQTIWRINVWYYTAP